MNARKVNDSVLELFHRHVDVDDIYVTHTIEQSDQCLDEIIEKGYSLILCGGGDGTAMRIIEQIHLKVEACNKAGGDYEMPKFGILKLGTGNAWAGLLGVPKGVKPIWKIQPLAFEELTYETFNMIEAEGRMFHFGGFGIDALILNDYLKLKNRFTKGILWKISNTLAGYFAATLFKSIPHILFKGFKLNVRIINDSNSPVYSASYSKGIREIPLKRGDVIYQGSVDTVIFGTTSDFGYKLKVMPFARAKSGYMNLRITNVNALKMLSQLRSIWLGKWEHRKLYDFLVRDIIIEIEQSAPFQLGGDPEGYRNNLHIKISDFTPCVLDFNGLSKD
ncbi:MAG: diacylglycerol kinase family protein [Spirochaetota bacterium]|nr:diacylglycerol kinase family protein [Spirochaetota bacterium]